MNLDFWKVLATLLFVGIICHILGWLWYWAMVMVVVASIFIFFILIIMILTVVAIIARRMTKK